MLLRDDYDNAVGDVNKAMESAMTFLAMEPSSDAMTENIRYFTSTYKLSVEDFVPREVSTFAGLNIVIDIEHNSYDNML